MKAIFIVTIAMFLSVSCAAIDGRRLEKDIANYTQTVETICKTAELFSAVGKTVPGAEYCEQALKAADLIQSRSDAFAVADTLRCVEKNDVKSVEFVECLSTVKWWPILADRIIRETQNVIDPE